MQFQTILNHSNEINSEKAASVLAAHPHWTGFTELIIRVVAQCALILAVVFASLLQIDPELVTLQALAAQFITCLYFSIVSYTVWSTLDMTSEWFCSIILSFYLLVTCIACLTLPWEFIPTILAIAICASASVAVVITLVMR